MKKYKIFSARVAGQLRRNGFKIIDTEINLKRPNFDVFIFEDTEALRAALYELTQKKAN